jgi:tetratricopeptide (TPR) repeat protein
MTMKLPTLLPFAFAALAGLTVPSLPGGPSARAIPAPSARLAGADSEASRDDRYRSARADLDAGRYAQAIEKFGQVAKAKGPAADGALYWKAYAEKKAGQPQQALATIRQLKGAYPKSAWIDDAKALAVEIGGPSALASGDAAKEDEELQLYALNGLLGSDPARALPILKRYLEGDRPQRLKEQALFVVSQCGAPAAHALLLETARGTAHPTLQTKAIDYLGIAGGPESVQVLDEIYRSSNRPEVKRQVLAAYLVANQRGRVLAIARDGNDPLQAQAIGQLGAMQAQGELKQIYDGAGSPKTKRMALDALGVAGGVDVLVGIARRDGSPEARGAAIRALGVTSPAKSGDALRALYTETNDAAIRRAVMDAFFVQNNAKSLIEIFRAEKDRETRREIVQRLSMMRSEEAIRFLEKIYNP